MEKRMDYTIENFEGCTITGLKHRTDNTKAMQVIPGLWETFFKENVPEQIENREPDPFVYAVYTGYESDEHGEYDFVLGGRSSGNRAKDALDQVEVPKGTYAVFTAQSADQVIAVWQQIWQTDLKRTYVADFERYDQQNGQVEIYVGID
jgi:predicted transcriptional regulator YdeE